MDLFSRIKVIEKQIVSLSKRDKNSASVNENNININALDILETEANLVEAVVDEFNAIVGEDE